MLIRNRKISQKYLQQMTEKTIRKIQNFTRG